MPPTITAENSNPSAPAGAPVRMVNGVVLPSPGVYDFDPGHTTVGFTGRHLLVTRVRGRFLDFRGHLEVGEGAEDSHGELVIKAASVESGFKDRDDHLRSADHLDVERYPDIVFRSTSIWHVEGDSWRAQGDLTVRDVTRQVEVAIDFLGGVVDPWGNSKIGFSASTEVDREDFGLTWNMLLEGGGLVAGRKVRLTVDVEAVRRP